MRFAKEEANAGPEHIKKSFDLTLMTQCHNDEALDSLNRAGMTEVWGYVKSHP
jgi:hypothetical protein